MVGEPNSFALYTIRERLPAILQQAIADSSFLLPSDIIKLETLAREIPEGRIRPIQPGNGGDETAWAEYVTPFDGKLWAAIPFYFAEAYFYRRILEAIRYFWADPPYHRDPFVQQKFLSLETARVAIRAIAPATPPTPQPPHQLHDPLIRLLFLALWGNRVDLSLWSATASDRIRTDVTQDAEKVLVDHSAVLADELSQRQSIRLDWIADNAGFELVCDLVMIDFLLSTQIAQTVYLHLKPHPLFVSDAMLPDVFGTLAKLAEDEDVAVRSLAIRLQTFFHDKRLRLEDDWFWAAPLPFWEMPLHLKQQLAQAQWVVIKGDANYRRLLGDRHWNFTTPLAAIAGDFPAPFIALRTLKSEVVAGLQAKQVEWLNLHDPQWLINGQWGVIQYANTMGNG
jgi:uncharacterized protein with ATP-grasp and redox domains